MGFYFHQKSTSEHFKMLSWDPFFKKWTLSSFIEGGRRNGRRGSILTLFQIKRSTVRSRKPSLHLSYEERRHIWRTKFNREMRYVMVKSRECMYSFFLKTIKFNLIAVSKRSRIRIPPGDFFVEAFVTEKVQKPFFGNTITI